MLSFKKIGNGSQKGGKKRKYEEVSQNENSNKRRINHAFFVEREAISRKM